MTYILLKKLGGIFLFSAGLTGLTCVLVQIAVEFTVRSSMTQSACDEQLAAYWFICEVIIPPIAVVASSAIFAFRYLEGKAGFVDFYIRLIACSGITVCAVSWSDFFPFWTGMC